MIDTETKTKTEQVQYKGYLLMLFMCGGGGIAYLIESLLFRLSYKPISEGLAYVIQIICQLIFLLILAFFLKSFYKQTQARSLTFFDYLRTVASATWFGIIVFAAGLIYRGGMFAAVVAYAGNGVISVVIIAISLIIILFLVVTVLFAIPVSMMPKGSQVSIFAVWRHISVLLLTVLVLILIIPGHALAGMLFDSYPALFGASFASRMMSKVLIALIYAVVFDRYIAYVVSRLGKTVTDTEDADLSDEKDQSRGVMLFKFIPLILVTILYMVSIITTRGNEDTNAITADIEAQLDMADLLIKDGSIAEGIREYMVASDMVSALDAYVKDDENELDRFIKEHPGDPFYIKLKYAVTNDPEVIEESIWQSDVDYSTVHAILNAYADKDRLKGKKQVLRKELTALCIAEEELVNKDDIGDAGEIKKTEIKSYIKEQSDRLAYGELLKEVLGIVQGGNASEEQVNMLLDMAEQNPDSMLYQLAAVSYASGAVSDDSHFLDRFSECVLRMDALYCMGDPSKEALINEKLYASELMLKCYDYENAMAILKEVADVGNEDVEDELMFCMNALEDYEGLADYAYKLSSEKNRAEILYYLAIAYLKTDEPDKSLEYAIKLSKLVEEAETADMERDSKFIYNYAQYASLKDTWRGIVDYKYALELNEEQKNKIGSTVLLNGYIEAIEDIFRNRDYESAIEVADRLEKSYPGLSMTPYIRGTAYLSDDDAEAAEKEFVECLNIDPDNMSAAYSLTVVYDELEDYEAAYAMCDKILVNLPEQDHGTDWYGIAIHVKQLKERLKDYVRD